MGMGMVIKTMIIAKMMIKNIDSTSITFDAYLDENKVLYIPDKILKLMSKLENNFKFETVEVIGNYTDTIFYLNRDLTEDEVDKIISYKI